jgi:hypothetical protein
MRALGRLGCSLRRFEVVEPDGQGIAAALADAVRSVDQGPVVADGGHRSAGGEEQDVDVGEYVNRVDFRAPIEHIRLLEEE